MAYRGVTARIPIGLQGFNGSRNPSQLQPGHLSYVDGADLDGGIIQKEGGADKINAIALAGSIISGFHWSPSPVGSYDIVFLDNGSVIRDSGSGVFTEIMVSGLSVINEPVPLFVPAGGETVGQPRKLFMFSALNLPQVALGTDQAMNQIANPAADWNAGGPTFGVQHANRLWAGGNGSDPHRVYYSTTGDHTNFTGTGSGNLSVFPGEGERLVGGISFKGMLILFKYPTGVFVVDTRDANIQNWSVAHLSRAVGGVNQHSILPIENDVLYLDHGGGIHLLSATSEFGDLNTSDIGQLADITSFMRQDVSLNGIRKATGVWYAAKRQAWFSMPQKGSSVNDLRLILDYSAGNQLPRFLLSRRDEATAYWMRPDSNGVYKPAFGDDNGFAWQLDTPFFAKDGLAYQMILESANTDLSFVDATLATKQKNGQFLEVVSESRGDWDLTVNVYWDDILTDTLQFNMGAGGAVLGEFELDVDTLGSDAIQSSRQRMEGSGRRVKLVLSNSGLGQNVSIAEVHLGFTVGDERAQDARA